MALSCTKDFALTISSYDCSTFAFDESIAQSSTFSRGCWAAAQEKLYVGRWSASSGPVNVYTINPLTLVTSIAIPYAGDSLQKRIVSCYYCTINQKVYVRDGWNRIYVIDPDTDTVVDTILVEADPGGNLYRSTGFCERNSKLFACHYSWPGGNEGNKIVRIDPTTNTVEAISAVGIFTDGYGMDDLTYASSVDRIYASISVSKGFPTFTKYSRLIAFDPDTLASLGYIDTGFIASTGAEFSRAVYVPTVNKLFASNEASTGIRVCTVTGGVDGIGEFESKIDTGSSKFLPLIYDPDCDLVICSESSWSVAEETISIDPSAKAIVHSLNHADAGYGMELVRIPPSGSDSRLYLFQTSARKIIGFANPTS